MAYMGVSCCTYRPKIPSSYVNRPVALLHVVGGEEVGDTSKLVEKVVLETEHGRRTDDRGLRVDITSDLLTPSLFYNVSMRLILSTANRRTLVRKKSDGEFASAL